MNDTDPRIRDLLLAAVEAGASDLHIVAGDPPTCRQHGRLKPIAEQPLDGKTIADMLASICPDGLFDVFRERKDLDFSFEIEADGRCFRFRANFFFNQQNIGACFRLIPSTIPSFKWAGFPEGLAQRLAQFRNGLVLLTGVAGSGKTTTLAMIITMLNRGGNCRIITIEEPVEYQFPKCPGSIVTQREVGLDVPSFSAGLKHGLRQDPDVILVGEIRDRDTAQMALSAAETGHLVFSTMHTRDAKGAITRFADLFPQNVQNDVRSQLAMSLRAVVSQHLLPSVTPDAKRELAIEVLFNNMPVSVAIRQGKIESIDNCIMTGKADGMITLDDSLRLLLQAERIDRKTAERFATNSHLNF
ncbi:MAG: PilT/PilU family type 4a pilus ATPase [Planctomycetes bacterium]|nr:PilT/PilU family type 4a pilus ATPase [Planctomycetota bacterium]